MDWLASEFIQSGWSVKAMHRLIMESAAYQRAAWQPDMANTLREKDSENRLLARFPTRRLQAEEIRDAATTASPTSTATSSIPSSPGFRAGPLRSMKPRNCRRTSPSPPICGRTPGLIASDAFRSK